MIILSVFLVDGRVLATHTSIFSISDDDHGFERYAIAMVYTEKKSGGG